MTTDALARLIEAVEAGDKMATVYAAREAFPLDDRRNLLRAADGSLNAAKALHDALLPGWIFDVTNGSAFVLRGLPDEDISVDVEGQFSGECDDSARAWLLAILRALQ